MARVIVRDRAGIAERRHLVREVLGVRAHLEHRGLLLSKHTRTRAIPSLR
jgi:hypothetical protein